jgi:hypothetical protein
LAIFIFDYITSLAAFHFHISASFSFQPEIVFQITFSALRHFHYCFHYWAIDDSLLTRLHISDSNISSLGQYDEFALYY